MMNKLLMVIMLSATPLGAAQQPVASPQNPPVAETVPGEAHPMVALRGAELPSFLNEKQSPRDYLNDAFLTAIPEAQVRTLTAQWRAQYGDAAQAKLLKQLSPHSASFIVEYDTATATVELTVDPRPPHKVGGLLVKGFAVKGDSLAKIETELAALPGEIAYVVQRLNGGQVLAARQADRSMAIASSFKLYVLAELAAQVRSGKRNWSDVVRLGTAVPSSPATERWPEGAPMTLQTLATQMISVSDNRATDSLIAALGRTTIEERIAKTGIVAPEKMFPLLTTTEAFVLKSQPQLRARYLAASEKQQRDFLERERRLLGADRIDYAQFAAGPASIDSIEWFASSNDLARLLGSFDLSDAALLSVLGVNSGVSAASAQKWKYLGYKGGSEPGVISMSFLAQSKAGDWYAVSGSWNNLTAPVDNDAFATLMARLLDSVQR